MVAAVVATGHLRRVDLAGSDPGRQPLLCESAPRRARRGWVVSVTNVARLTAVTPTATEVIRALGEQLDVLERGVRAAREALVMAEVELLAARSDHGVRPEALTTDQVAESLGLSRSTVTSMIGRGELASVKIGGARRVRRRDLDEYLERLGTGGAA